MDKPRIRWLRMLALAAMVPLAGWLARPWLRTTTVEQLERQYQAQIVALSPYDAAQLVHQLAEEDSLWLNVLVAASSDARPKVATAAQVELREMIDRWATLLPEESSFRVSQLAEALAQNAASQPPGQRQFIHSLAHRLLDWPIEGQEIDAAKFIANCEAVLLLPVAEDSDIRVAAAVVVSAPPPPAEPPPALPAAVVPVMPPPPPPQIPAPIVAQEPVPLPQANHETPVEPKQFLPPKAMRISDE